MEGEGKKQEGEGRPEILAPVGNWPMFQAALAAGADAVYLAAESYGARAFAENFSLSEIRQLTAYAHLHGVKVYIAVNTLIREEEMEDCLKAVFLLYSYGCDAFLVQDLGLFALLRRLLPEACLHASTQLSVTSLAGASLLEEMGFQRLVAGRESSLEEIRQIREGTHLELEVFIHGSLCVSQSGQCLLSSFAGGRSGNRGSCAQPCRKTYRIGDGEGRMIGREDSYLSSRDLMTLDRLDELAQAGVTSFKIEGRMKKAAYVYQTVKAYRQALEGRAVSPEKMELMTNRPFTQGFLFYDFAADYAYLKGMESGLELGRVEKKGASLFFRPDRPLSRGDSLRLQGGSHPFNLTLRRDYQKAEKIDLSAYPDIRLGSAVYWIFSEEAQREVEEGKEALRQVKFPVQGRLLIRKGQPAQLSFWLEAGGEKREGQARGPMPEEARTQALTKEGLRKRMGKLGESPFCLDALQIELDEGLFMRLSDLNLLRRQAADDLLGKIGSSRPEVCWEERVGRLKKAGKKGREDGLSKKPASPPSLVLACSLPPSAYSKDLLSHFRAALISGRQAWKEWQVYHQGRQGAFHLYYQLPRLMEEEQRREEEAFWRKEGVRHFYCQTLNEAGAVLSYRRRAGGEKPLSLVLGYGMNLFNPASLELLGWLEEMGLRVDAFLPSVELPAEALVRFPQRERCWLPVYGRLDGMSLKYCPLSTLKKCRDSSQCESCPYRSGYFLVDAYGRREMVREGKMTRLLLPDLLDLRESPGLFTMMREGRLSSGLVLLDQGEGDFEEVVQDWVSGQPGRKHRKKWPVSLGHYQQGVE